MNSLNVADYLKDKFRNKPGEKAAEVAKEILNLTGHIPVVTAVARGAGFCTYHARLTEGIGAKSLGGHVLDRASGKGDDVHKILGLTSLEFFAGHHNISEVKRIIEDISGELLKHYIINEHDIEKNKLEAEYLMQGLLSNLDRFLNITGMERSDIVPIVEQQFVDYELHMRGIPDLILESRREQKAIVIDWKTSRETPSKYENAQVVCYALLEGRRLGYDVQDAIEKITGSFSNDTISGIEILPVILRGQPNLSLKPHPIFSGIDEVGKRFREFCVLVRNVVMVAQHLTLLVTNQREITGVDPMETTGPIENGSMVNYVRLTPFDLGLYHGNPREQQKYPCSICYLKDPCRFYFGRKFGEIEDYEKTMWRLRYSVFAQKERSLLIYRALYEIGEFYGMNDILETIRRGMGFIYRPGMKPNKKHTPNLRVVISSNKKEDQVISRIDALDALEVNSNNPFLIIGKRRIRDHEEQKRKLFFINEKKPVMICMHNGQDINPALCVNFFGRIKEINVDAENNFLEYEIDVPSRILRYQMLVFSKYLITSYSTTRNAVMFSVDVDLTQMELQAIDWLQRELSKPENEKDLDEEQKKEVKEEVNLLNQSKSDSVDSNDEEALENQLRKLIEASRKKP